MIHEAMIAIAIAIAALTGVAQLVAFVAHQVRVSERYAVARAEVGNLMEELMSRPWADLTPEDVAEIQLSEPCQRCLPDAELRVDMASENGSNDVHRIHLQIDWRDAANRRGDPVRLVAWRYRYEEAGP